MHKAIGWGAVVVCALGVSACHGEEPARTPDAVKYDLEGAAQKAGEGIEKAGSAIERGAQKIDDKMEEKREELRPPPPSPPPNP